VEGYGRFIAVLSQFCDRKQRFREEVQLGFADMDKAWKGKRRVVDGSQVSLFELP
jgi:hypothetical protein